MHVVDDPRGWEMVDDRSFDVWKAAVFGDAPDRCSECGGPLTPADASEDDNWSDVDADLRWCEGEVIRRFCITSYDLPWSELRRGHPSTLGEVMYERIVRRQAAGSTLGALGSENAHELIGV